MARPILLLVAALTILFPSESVASPDTLSVDVSRAAIRSMLLNGPYEAQQVVGQRLARKDRSRSVGMAFGMSALLPGSGQVYNSQKFKAIVSVAMEAALITGYSVLRSRGIDAEDAFQVKAHARWNPEKYATWLNDYSEFLGEELGVRITAPSVNIISGVDFQNPSSWSAADRSAVQAMFDQVTAIERQAIHPETGAAFSHQLPDFAQQQYYELIGKYFQFAPGWEDYPVWRDAEGNFLASIDPEKTAEDGSKPNVSDEFFSYASEHAHAQDVLRKASQMSLLFVFNHLIASIDAAVSAKKHNDRLATRMGMTYDTQGKPVPVATLSLRF